MTAPPRITRTGRTTPKSGTKYTFWMTDRVMKSDAQLDDDTKVRTSSHPYTHAVCFLDRGVWFARSFHGNRDGAAKSVGSHPTNHCIVDIDIID